MFTFQFNYKNKVLRRMCVFGIIKMDNICHKFVLPIQIYCVDVKDYKQNQNFEICKNNIEHKKVIILTNPDMFISVIDHACFFFNTFYSI